MGFHIITSTYFDFAQFVERAKNDQGPRHVYYQVGERLKATIHQPNPQSVSWIDKLLSKIASPPEHWAIARRLIRQLSSQDVVYCAGIDAGIPFLMLSLFRANRPKLAVNLVDPKQTRVRLLLEYLGLGNGIDLFVTNTRIKADYLKQKFKRTDQQVFVTPEQTDANFFKPLTGDAPQKQRPVLASAGLEHRDYKTLALAIAGMDVDIKICAFSPNAHTKMRTTFPDPVPTNMEIRYFDWVELRELYQTSEMVILSLVQNEFSAGLTVLMEAMACKRPVIMTRTPGLAEDLIRKGVIVGVEAGDVQGLSQAIRRLLENPQEADLLAEKAYQYFQVHHTSDRFVETLAHRIEALAPLQPPKDPIAQAHETDCLTEVGKG